MARILVTRPEPGLSATAGRLTALGHQVMTAPLFNVHSVEWSPPGELFDALMLTSANAVRLAGPLPDRWRGLPCYCVGKATAHAAAIYGFPNVVTGASDVEALAARMAGDGVGTALHLAGREHRPATALTPHILTRIVYAADAVGRLDPSVTTQLAAGYVDRVLLYSARASRQFALLADETGLDRKRISLGALSRQAANAAGMGWRNVEIADAPTEDQLFAACGLLCDKRKTPVQQGHD